MSRPGQPIDIGPRAGDILGVIGVEHDDVLNVRVAPGTDQTIVATLDPVADNVVARGRARALSRSIWYEVTVGGTTGWASSRFLAFLGRTDDATAEVVGTVGEVPVAETMAELGRVVAHSLASADPPSTITLTVAPTIGDVGVVVYDVVGLGDDSVMGWRLRVFGQPTESGEAFSLMTVERTALCGRGVTGDGLCV